MARIPFVGGSYPLKRKKADAQQTVNMIVCNVESGSGKARQFLKSIPGLTRFSKTAFAITKEQADDSIVPGATQTYSVTVTNQGPVDSTLTVKDPAPTGFALVACAIAYSGGAAGPASATALEIADGVALTAWPVGGVATLTITGTYAEVGTYVNTATALVEDVRATASVSTVVAEPPEEDIAWDGVDISAHWALSNSNQTANLTSILSSDPAYGVKLDHFRHTGKRYLELVVDHLAMSGFEAEDMSYQIVGSAFDVNATGYPGNTAHAWERMRASYVLHNSVREANGETQPTVDQDGDILMVAMDFDTGVVAFGVNGQWFNNGTSVPDQSFVPSTQAFPAYTNLVGPVTFALWGFAGGITCSFTIRTKNADFSYKPAGWTSFATVDV